MLRKTTLLAMAIAVVGVLSIPASAMGGWKIHNTPITKNAQLQLTGNTKFQAAGVGSISCQITAQATLEASQTTGAITQLEPDLDAEGSTVTQACVASGFLIECQVHAVQPTGLPWVLHTTVNEAGQARIDVTHGEIHYQLTGSFCAATDATVTAGTVELVPNQPNTVSSFQWTGNATVHDQLIDSQQITAKTNVSGSTQILESEQCSKPNTYSI